MNAHTLINTSGQGGSNNKGFKRQVYLYMRWPWGTWTCMRLWLQFQASPKHRVHLQTRCVNAACGAAGAIQKNVLLLIVTKSCAAVRPWAVSCFNDVGTFF